MRYLLLLMMGLMSLPSFASTKVNLYQTEVVIDNQQSNAEADARMRGLQEVIIRASGDKESIKNDVIQKALQQSAQYLNQISYGQQGGDKTLNMTFSAPHIRSLITQAHLPFWSEERANILIWLVEESGYERHIRWEHDNTELMRQLKSSAQQRGLPFIIPVGDFDDITGIQTSDLWGGFTQPISFASQSYATDAIAVIRVQGSQVRWTLYDQPAEQMLASPKKPLTGQASGEQAISVFIDEISDYYARKSAVMVGSESSLKLLAVFKPVNNAHSFFTLEESLKRLSSVASLDVVKIKGDEVTFNVHLLASEEEFEQEALRLQNVAKRTAPYVEPVQPMDDIAESNQEAGTDDLALDNVEPVNVPAPEPQDSVLYFSWQD